MAEVARPVRGGFVPGWVGRLSRPQMGMCVLIGAFAFYLLYPLFLILLNSFNTARVGAPPVYGVDSWVTAWQTPSLWNALRNTLSVAVVYQMISFPLGVAVAWLLARTNVP